MFFGNKPCNATDEVFGAGLDLKHLHVLQECFFLSNLKKTTSEFNYAIHSRKIHKVIEFPL